MNKQSILIASLLLGLAGSAWAYGPGPGQGPDGDAPRQGMERGMNSMHGGHGVLGAAYRVDNLTADQRKQLDALRDKQRQQFEANRADRDALHEALANGADAKTIRPLAEKEGKHVTEMIMRQVEVRDEVNKILTEPQRAQLKELLSQNASREPGERGPRGDRRGR